MKISELEEHLKTLRQMYGDLEVESYNGYGTAAPDPEVVENMDGMKVLL